MDSVFAWHITWTCYGTWLPGDERGHVSNIIHRDGGWEPKRNTPGSPAAAGDANMRERARALQKGETVWLTVAQAECAARAMVDAARRRGWRIMRAAIMSNHIHAVICDCPNDGPAVRRALKGVSQAELSESLGKSQRWWTAGGSDRAKTDSIAIENAVNYVANQENKLVEIIDNEVYVLR
jgi:REP element-mobilizing transposase RayT